MKYKIINWLLFFLVIAFAGNIVRSMANLSQQDNVIRDTKDQLQKAMDDNQNLNRQLAQSQSQQFIEQEARNKLNLGREGEIVVIMPSISPLITPTPVPPDLSANWEKWVKLFL